MKFILWISNRLRINGNNSNANATGIVIAIAGVALALAIMECTIAIVVGFKNQITDRIMGFDGEISVLPAYDYASATSAQFIEFTPELDSLIHNTLPDSQPYLKLQQPGIIKTDNDFAGIYFIGFSDNHNAQFQSDHMAKGQFPDFSSQENTNKIVISQHTANTMQLDVADKVYAYFFANDAVKTRRFEIAGIYDTGFSDYDKTIAYASIATLQAISTIDSLAATQIQLSASSRDNISDDAALLQNEIIQLYQNDQLSQLYPIDNVKHTGAVFFNWLDLLDTNVVVIFILMACVAGFTLISSMFILTLDRIPTIGMLRALGATKRQMRMTFSMMAMRIVLLALCIGNAFGIGLLLAQQKWEFLKLNPDMYYLPSVPVEINWHWIILLNIIVALIAWVLLYLPTHIISSISPASTMRFE